MPSITLTDPTTGTTIASGWASTNNANLRALLNSGLDYVNLKGNPQLVSGEFPVWNGTQFNRSSVTGIGNASIDAAAAITRSKLARDATKIYMSADQVISTGTITLVNFNSEIVDDSALHDNVTNNSRISFTAAATAGLWVVGAQTLWQNVTAGDRYLEIRQTGTTTVARAVSQRDNFVGTAPNTVSGVIFTSPGDYLELYVGHNQGANLNLLSGVQGTVLWAVRI